MSPVDIDSFVTALPKCEVHLHFEGAVPMRLVQEWCTEELPEAPPWRRRDYRYGSFATEFSEVMRVTWRGTCDTLERLDVASTEIYRDLAAQNVLYLEMSIGIGAYPYPPAETLAAFKNGIPDGLTVRIIGGLSRDRDFKLIHDAGTAYAACGALNGLDLHGLESEGDPRMFLDLYEMGRERGLILKAHAGEMSGPDSIVSILDSLNVKRIEHGVRGIESDALVQRYIDEDITLDLCPWSNVKLGVYPDLKCHPVRDLHRRGVRVTVNTDDPTPFGQTLTEEYSWLLTECGLSVEEVGAIAKNGFVIADLDERAKGQAIRKIDALVSKYAKASR
ncbi:MAG TPA: hypothetical protein DHW45_10680 [Candidatus Latescibacteria bacterium]|nr:hypothetical protein [Candidatus Latescibacterota bacterium]